MQLSRITKKENYGSKLMQTITLIGVGLIGSSLALDLKQNNIAQTIIGVDSNGNNLSLALEQGIIDVATNDLDEQSANSDMIIIAVPVMAVQTIAEKLTPLLNNPNTIITDVGSSKQKIIEIFRNSIPEYFANFVAAHPIAGSDKSGSKSAISGLFKHKKLIICPHEKQNSASLKTVQNMWEKIGANCHIMNATEHDYVFAIVSHLPHLLSFAFMHQANSYEESQKLLSFAGTGFQDFTRIAASNPSVWTDITFSNKTEILNCINDFEANVRIMKQAIENNDKNALKDFFQAACNARRDWSKDNEQY